MDKFLFLSGGAFVPIAPIAATPMPGTLLADSLSIVSLKCEKL